MKTNNLNINIATCNRFIFLDIDGVIATPKTIKDGMWALTPEKQDLLGTILEKTGAKIIISSSWRQETLESTIEYMKAKDFRFCDEIIGITIRAYHYIEKNIHLSIPRGVEIKQWLDTHVISPWIAYPEQKEQYQVFNEDGSFKKMRSNKVEEDFTYVILDDDSDMLYEQSKYFIHCDSMEGLNDTQTNKAITLLIPRKKMNGLEALINAQGLLKDISEEEFQQLLIDVK